MARIAGVDLPRDKAIEYALPIIYGIGLSSGRQILAQAGIDPRTKVRDMTEAETAKLREIIEREWRVEGDLRRAGGQPGGERRPLPPVGRSRTHAAQR